ncbi:hypothetical protein [Rhodococcus qingshengii]|uniref:hypothetical protein n=1 Tax=Rhodococcus qingshengii TaxID=334542 RepID=UPI0036D9217E
MSAIVQMLFLPGLLVATRWRPRMARSDAECHEELIRQKVAKRDSASQVPTGQQ